MSTGIYLDFEKPVIELEKRIDQMREFASDENLELTKEIRLLEHKLDRLRRETFSKLTRWQRIQLARHPMRPYTAEYIELITEEYVALYGDRAFRDDRALIGGFAKIDSLHVLILGQQKGRTTKQKLAHNFGMCHPEGYRKALRLMDLAGRFGRPIIILIDTPGAFPGIEAEERGQAEAIARNIRDMAALPVPIIVVIIGEGASGGALGIGIGDRVLMLENSWYSVISPEGCAAILWKDHPNPVQKAPEAAEALRPTAPDLKEFGIIDDILPEPLGGAHRNPEEQGAIIKQAVLTHLRELMSWPVQELIRKRHEKYRKMGPFAE
jgi:acetyl-CoA carboxylase carboxyl transferase subunit alpha